MDPISHKAQEGAIHFQVFLPVPVEPCTKKEYADTPFFLFIKEMAMILPPA
jgi:hypothetical protein